MTPEEAIDKLKGFDFIGSNEDIEFQYALGMAIKALEQEPKWIPVSDKLPNFNDIVLASADINLNELRVIITVYSGEEFWFNGKIKAWMPLPEPYKAESEDKNDMG